MFVPKLFLVDGHWSMGGGSKAPTRAWHPGQALGEECHKRKARNTWPQAKTSMAAYLIWCRDRNRRDQFERDTAFAFTRSWPSTSLVSFSSPMLPGKLSCFATTCRSRKFPKLLWPIWKVLCILFSSALSHPKPRMRTLGSVNKSLTAWGSWKPMLLVCSSTHTVALDSCMRDTLLFWPAFHSGFHSRSMVIKGSCMEALSLLMASAAWAGLSTMYTSSPLPR
mmetsp:Transcript_20588/g.57401  ORF Transcript_20588/g.57401 Transcript_20588/m.57401 type:complete len:223 (-) Transcript_20588:1218-1886(-)